MTSSAQVPPSAYFGSLTLENVKCFQGEHKINLSDGNRKPAMWTVILGNNNTGKTTLLRCLADLEPKLDMKSKNFIPKISNLSLRKLDYTIQCKWVFSKKIDYDGCWYFRSSNNSSSYLGIPYKTIGNAIIYGYGTSRRIANTSLMDNENQDNTATLSEDNLTLINAEEFILQTDYASNKIKSAKFRLEKIRQILTNGLLPDVKNFRCKSIEQNNKIRNFVEFETDYGWVKLRELGYGYQTTLAWVIDLAKKLFERYPRSKNPLHQPAIVLVDEIDLHLHPEWQRKIIQFLKTQFPKTQFIVTTHSPLIIQSMDDINLVLLEKEDDHAIIKQPDLKNYQGWTVEEILDELMGLGERILSDNYLKFMQQFDEALDEDNYNKAKNAYDELDKIIHSPSARKLLRIQMAGLNSA